LKRAAHRAGVCQDCFQSGGFVFLTEHTVAKKKIKKGGFADIAVNDRVFAVINLPAICSPIPHSLFFAYNVLWLK